jgi:hypothetical protein
MAATYFTTECIGAICKIINKSESKEEASKVFMSHAGTGNQATTNNQKGLKQEKANNQTKTNNQKGLKQEKANNQTKTNNQKGLKQEKANNQMSTHNQRQNTSEDDDTTFKLPNNWRQIREKDANGNDIAYYYNKSNPDATQWDLPTSEQLNLPKGWEIYVNTNTANGPMYMVYYTNGSASQWDPPQSGGRGGKSRRRGVGGRGGVHRGTRRR